MKVELKKSNGNLLSKADIDHFRSLRKAHYESGFKDEKADKNGVRRAEGFSKEIIEQLLRVDGCEGLVICYGAAPETDHKIDKDKGKNIMPRLLIVPVDAQGNHLTFDVSIPGQKDGSGSYAGAGNGAPCPPERYCPQD